MFRKVLSAVALLAAVALTAGCSRQPSPADVDARVASVQLAVERLRDEVHALKPCGCACEGDCCKCDKGKGCEGCCKGCCPKTAPSITAVNIMRVETLTDHAAAFSRITGVYFAYAKPETPICEDAEAGADMAEALAKAREVINRNAILFDLGFNQDADRYFEIFRQMNQLPVTEWHEYRKWIAGLTNAFDDVCKDRIAKAEGKLGEDAPAARMPLAPIGYAERIKLGAREYLRLQREHPPKPAPRMPACEDDEDDAAAPAKVRIRIEMEKPPRSGVGVESDDKCAKRCPKAAPAPAAPPASYYTLPRVSPWGVPQGPLVEDICVAEEGLGD